MERKNTKKVAKWGKKFLVCTFVCIVCVCVLAHVCVSVCVYIQYIYKYVYIDNILFLLKE